MTFLCCGLKENSMKLQNHTVNFYKLQAKRLKRELNIKHTDALNIVAKNYGFSNWIDCQRSISRNTEFSVNTAIPLNFTTWLHKQINRNSPLGDLAKDVEKDTHWPLYDDLESYNIYLHSKGVSGIVFIVLKNAWKSYNAYLKRNLLPKEKKASKPSLRNSDPRKITIVKNVKPIHFDKRTPEKFNVGDKAWISWNGRKAFPVTITEVTDRNYSFKIERPLKNRGDVHFLFLDEVRSTPQLACINHVT